MRTLDRDKIKGLFFVDMKTRTTDEARGGQEAGLNWRSK
jgi:hypothetical protein